MIRRFRKPTKAQDRAALKVQWVFFTRIDGYREPYFNEPRHHWVRRSWIRVKTYERVVVVECAHCGLIMPLDGSHRRLCFGSLRE